MSRVAQSPEPTPPPAAAAVNAGCMQRLVGIGLRQPHAAALLAAPPPLAFVEVHSENHFGDGGAALALLMRARQHWPVSLHGVGLSLGSATGLDAAHLDRLAALVQRIQPVRVSDHCCFARAAWGPQPLRPAQLSATPFEIDNATTVVHANDLLPVAYTEASLHIMATNVQRVQDRLKRRLLVENLSAYLHWADNEMTETEFLNRLTRHTGCGLLLDVNNLVVNALNEQPGSARDEAAAVQTACDWVDRIDAGCVGEMHLAGYADAGDIVIDDHGSRVRHGVWQVYRHALQRLGPVPTLVEWDTALPALAVLLAEAQTAESQAAEAVCAAVAGRAAWTA